MKCFLCIIYSQTCSMNLVEVHVMTLAETRFSFSAFDFATRCSIYRRCWDYSRNLVGIILLTDFNLGLIFMDEALIEFNGVIIWLEPVDDICLNNGQMLVWHQGCQIQSFLLSPDEWQFSSESLFWLHLSFVCFLSQWFSGQWLHVHKRTATCTSLPLLTFGQRLNCWVENTRSLICFNVWCP